jgi:hypothetical protein
MQSEVLERAYGCAVWIDTDPETGRIRILPRF